MKNLNYLVNVCLEDYKSDKNYRNMALKNYDIFLKYLRDIISEAIRMNIHRTNMGYRQELNVPIYTEGASYRSKDAMRLHFPPEWSGISNEFTLNFAITLDKELRKEGVTSVGGSYSHNPYHNEITISFQISHPEYKIIHEDNDTNIEEVTRKYLKQAVPSFESQKFKNAFAHEFIHLFDYHRVWSKDTSRKVFASYAKQSTGVEYFKKIPEVNAFTQNILQMLDTKYFNKNSTFQDVINSLRTILLKDESVLLGFLDSLEGAQKRRFYNRLYNWYVKNVRDDVSEV